MSDDLWLINLFKRKIIRKSEGYFDDDPGISQFYETTYLESNPSLHEENINIKFNTIKPFIQYINKNSNKNISIIADIGSGSFAVMQTIRSYLEELQGSKINVIGVDISKSILLQNKNKYNILPLRADAQDLPLQDNSIQIALCIDVIEHLQNPSVAVGEACRVSDYVIIKTPLEISLYTLLRGGKSRLEKMERKYGHIQHFKRSDVINLLPEDADIVMESYQKIPGRSILVDKLQEFLLKFEFYFSFRWLFGGFTVLMIKQS